MALARSAQRVSRCPRMTHSADSMAACFPRALGCVASAAPLGGQRPPRRPDDSWRGDGTSSPTG
eukprot:3095331-Pyramimonas_sp.AAC.1